MALPAIKRMKAIGLSRPWRENCSSMIVLMKVKIANRLIRMQTAEKRGLVTLTSQRNEGWLMETGASREMKRAMEAPRKEYWPSFVGLMACWKIAELRKSSEV